LAKDKREKTAMGVFGKRCDGTDVSVINAVTAAFKVDNRIADGIYAGRALKLFEDFVENPEKLEMPQHCGGSPAR
jgi:pyruvate/2-oxoglutarate dehydrogenase complex dihydrolipoamide acyltransferase (E2) component